jgi:hypothetical protein
MLGTLVTRGTIFPSRLDPRVKDFILKLLTKHCGKRPTFEQMKSDPCFEGFDLGRVIRREYGPSFIPPVKDPLTPVNIDWIRESSWILVHR